MDFVPGRAYQNARGQLLVMGVGPTTIKLEYLTGPQAGRVLLKRIADMTHLATRELLAPPPAKGPRRGRNQAE